VQVEKPKLQKRSRSARRRHWIIGQDARWPQSQAVPLSFALFDNRAEQRNN